MDINDLIDNLKAGNNVGAGETFNSIMSDRINSAMDARKVEIGQGFNQPEAEEELELAAEEELDNELEVEAEAEDEVVYADQDESEPE
jgi:hypothetical protein